MRDFFSLLIVVAISAPQTSSQAAGAEPQRRSIVVIAEPETEITIRVAPIAGSAASVPKRPAPPEDLGLEEDEEEISEPDGAPQAGDGQDPPQPAPPPTKQLPGRSRIVRPTPTSKETEQGAPEFRKVSPQEVAFQATVRLKVMDGSGSSTGTGTIVHVHGDEALVVTCGHLFRHGGFDSRVVVHQFQGARYQAREGTLVDYNLDIDVGLVCFRPLGSVTPVVLAPATHQVRSGEEVLSIGCSHGEPPTIWSSRIKSLNRFAGADNLQVVGQPVTGRSGGGLFSREGLLIGVCNAADPTDDQGLYAAASRVREQLNQNGLGVAYAQHTHAVQHEKN